MRLSLKIALAIIAVILGALAITGYITHNATHPTHSTGTGIALPAITSTSTPAPNLTDDQINATATAQVVSTFKASTTNTTVAALVKDGNNDQNENVHFTCIMRNAIFGVEVNVTDASGKVLRLALPDNTVTNQLHPGNTLEVWGTDSGVSIATQSSPEVGITVFYVIDRTTGYQPPYN